VIFILISLFAVDFVGKTKIQLNLTNPIPMKEELLNLLNSIFPLSDELETELSFYLKFEQFPKKAHLLKEGQICNYIYFIEQGLVRSYYLKDENEVCSWFMKEGDVIISVDSFYNKKPGYESIQAIEDTTVYFINYDELQLLYKKFVEFNIIGRVLTEKYYQLSEQRLFSMRKQTASERYDFLLQHHAEIVQRVPKKYIASYLGVSVETLSRI